MFSVAFWIFRCCASHVVCDLFYFTLLLHAALWRSYSILAVNQSGRQKNETQLIKKKIVSRGKEKLCNTIYIITAH